MSINDNFWTRVSKEQDNFTKKERILINFISYNSHKMNNITISVLSEINKVGYSVIYKLIKKLNFSGYREFIISLVSQENTFKALNQEFFGDRSVLKESYKRLLDLNDATIDYNKIQEFTNWLNNRRKECKPIIYIAGIGHSGLGAEDLALKLSRFGLKTVCLNKDDDSIKMHCALLNHEDILLVFSLSGKTSSIIEAAKLAKANKAVVVVVTSQGKTTLNDSADWLFTIISSGLSEEKEIFVSPLFAITYFNDLLSSYLLKSADGDWYLEKRKKTNTVIKKF